MDVIISELDDSLVRFIAGLPLDVVVLLAILYTSASLSFYIFKTQRRAALTLFLISSFSAFGAYYLYLRLYLLDSPFSALVFAVFAAGCGISTVAFVAQRRRRVFRLIKLVAVTALRRTLDCVLALTALLILSPVMIVISILIKITTGGTILIRQPSSSHSGKSIMLYSFRTQIPYKYSYINDAFFMASENDWRLTSFGRILHKSSLHVLPRLFNVLNGDLHLVGMTPLKTRLLVSAFAKELLRREHDLVAKLNDDKDIKAFHLLIDYHIPTGVITYSDLNAYKLQPSSRTVLKFLDIRPRLREEAEYFTSRSFPSLRLFIVMLGTLAIRVLTALNLLRLEEIREGWQESVKEKAI